MAHTMGTLKWEKIKGRICAAF